MKRIKMFDNFQINEISQGLINRARDKARTISKDTFTNPLDKPIKSRQADKFTYSKDKNLVNYARTLGFEFEKNSHEYDLRLKNKYIFIFDKQGTFTKVIYLSNGNQIENLNYIESTTLRKVKKFETELKKSINSGLDNSEL